ncbi:MAG: DnaD domain protein [Eubacterium sp.]|nr:DnaD domain protein [Eubacterium sp.]
MDYSIVPIGGIWANGAFNVPLAVADKYIRLASEYQLKALLIILSTNGKSSSAEIAKKLGITSSDAEEIMEFWIEEGAVTADGMEAKPISAPIQEVTAAEKPSKKIQITAPALTPKDIVDAAQENEEIADLLNESQVVLGRTLSHNEREMLVNMVDFYGLKSEIVLMILQYWRSVNEKENSRAKGIAYVLKIAQNWLDDGIDTMEAAEEKLMQLEKSNKLWKEIAVLAGVEHKKPTIRQGEMVLGWSNDFSFDMIAAAIEQMRENTASPSLPYVDKILKSWKKKGLKTLSDVENENKAFEKSKAEQPSKKSYRNERVQGTPSFDLDEIMKNARNNTDIKF